MIGVYHIHSNFSYDGKNSVSEIAEWARAQKLDFVIITEHDKDFTDKKFRAYFQECQRSSEGVELIPGIEYSFNAHGTWVHVGVFGIPFLIKNDTEFGKMEAFLGKVRELGGVSVLNHPVDIIHLIPESVLLKFDLVELWNTKYDHTYAPNADNLLMLRSLKGNCHFIASSDLHSTTTGDYVKINVESEALSSVNDSVMTALKTGRFSSGFKGWTVCPDGKIFSNLRIKRFVLPTFSQYHRKVYNSLRWVSRRLQWKPPPFIVRLVKLKIRGNGS